MEKEKEEDCKICTEKFDSKVASIVETAYKSIVKMEEEHVKSITIREQRDKEFYKLRAFKFDTALANQQEKANIFYDDQEEKIKSVIKEAIKEMTSTIKWFLGVVLIIVMGVVGLTIGNTVGLAGKANANEVFSLKDAKTLRMAGDAYYDQRYVLKSGETIDKYTYQWHMETIFEKLNRGGHLQKNNLNK